MKQKLRSEKIENIKCQKQLSEEIKTKMKNKQIESLKNVDMSGLDVPFIAVYRNPEDFPGKYVAMIYDMDKPTDAVMVKSTLAEIDEDVRQNIGMVFVPRGPEDVPSLIGVYIAD